ncbi:aspartate/glutamate racemase family protein [Aliagarivorans taiwanensis]|uniref:aspartate/glutamate racemase family protein n=1 Tax=Aliagarivorans taiwanensis TaxID=561966 RepID=UPI0004242C1F|nr:aspartate/glutamate racemase family protein [Aliagarivorans taiwanensis]
MKTIGILGGMSWESTVTYYQGLNRAVKQRLGGLHSAKLVLLSVDFAEIERLQHQGEWQQLGELLAANARQVEAAGAEGLLIATNTMHKVAEPVAAAIGIPLLHLADATAEHLLTQGIRRVGLLGTRFTMEQAFYRERIEARGIEVVVPDAAERELVHRVIYDELCHGQIVDSSRQGYLRIIDNLAKQGAQGVILGCTEIGLLVDAQHTAVPLFDTTAIHIEQAVNWALA